MESENQLWRISLINPDFSGLNNHDLENPKKPLELTESPCLTHKTYEEIKTPQINRLLAHTLKVLLVDDSTFNLYALR